MHRESVYNSYIEYSVKAPTYVEGSSVSGQKLNPDDVRKNLRVWFSVMQADHAMVMAGLRRKIGPDGDLHSAFRDWYRDHQERKIQELEHIHRHAP